MTAELLIVSIYIQKEAVGHGVTHVRRVLPEPTRKRVLNE
jgi:hypothetical protein